jgi:hypothetical protein
MGKRKESKKVSVKKKLISEKIGFQLVEMKTEENKGRSRKVVKVGLRPSIRKKRNSRKTPMSVGKVRFTQGILKKDNKGRLCSLVVKVIGFKKVFFFNFCYFFV